VKTKELIEKLRSFDGELEVELTDGYECVFYSLDKAVFQVFFDDESHSYILDIGIGGCQKE